MCLEVKAGSFTLAKVNEDAFGYSQDCAWVLDGSTGLNGKRLVAEENSSDAQWYTKAYSSFLNENLPGSTESLPELMARGVKTVWAEFLEKAGGPVPREDVPCTVGTVVRIRDGYLEYACVGDCCLLVRCCDGTVIELLDDTLCALDKESIRIGVEIARREGLPLKACREKLLPRLLQVRLTMNTPEGYISLANNPDVVLQAVSGKIPLEKIRDICIVSDGFSEYYAMFSLADTVAAFMDQVANLEPRELFRRLVAAQKADEALEKYPRFKLSDDATILYWPIQ